MKYQENIKLITTYLQMHKSAIDALAEKYKAKNAEIEKKIASGELSEKGIENLKAAEAPKLAAYTPIIKEIQTKTRSAVLSPMRDVKAELDDIFAKPVQIEFATKITAIASAGMKLTNAEFELLNEQAGSYMEKRLLQTLADNRTKTVRETVLLGDNPATDLRYRDREISDQYDLEIPSIDAAYAAYQDFKISVDGMISYYSGENAEFADALPPVDPLGGKVDGAVMFGLANSYFNNEHEQKFLEVMQALDGSVTDNLNIPLSDREKRIVDAIIIPDEFEKHPMSSQWHIKQASAEDPYIRNLFLRDPRYAAIVKE